MPLSEEELENHKKIEAFLGERLWTPDDYNSAKEAMYEKGALLENSLRNLGIKVPDPSPESELHSEAQKQYEKSGDYRDYAAQQRSGAAYITALRGLQDSLQQNIWDTQNGRMTIDELRHYWAERPATALSQDQNTSVALHSRSTAGNSGSKQPESEDLRRTAAYNIRNARTKRKKPSKG
ncbi:hypothetical protein P3L51_21690 [Streptomyces sp. PSRA5]|uniref:hypothetical protein n=1 Tax=Streptomyces panacea TaxID=3035064 RepID=UPI00339C85AF